MSCDRLIRGEGVHSGVQQVSRFFYDCDCDFLTQVEKSQRFLGPKSAFSLPESLAIVSCDEKSQAIAILFAIFRGKKRPHCGLAGDGDFRDRKSRRFAIAIFGALRYAGILSWN